MMSLKMSNLFFAGLLVFIFCVVPLHGMYYKFYNESEDEIEVRIEYKFLENDLEVSGETLWNKNLWRRGYWCSTIKNGCSDQDDDDSRELKKYRRMHFVSLCIDCEEKTYTCDDKKMLNKFLKNCSNYYFDISRDGDELVIDGKKGTLHMWETGSVFLSDNEYRLLNSSGEDLLVTINDKEPKQELKSGAYIVIKGLIRKIKLYYQGIPYVSKCHCEIFGAGKIHYQLQKTSRGERGDFLVEIGNSYFSTFCYFRK